MIRQLSTRRRPAAYIATAAAALMVTTACAGASSTPSGGDDDGQTQSQTGLEDMEPVTITITEITNEAGAQGTAYHAMADQIEKASGGKIDFEFYFSGALTSGDEMLTAIGSGVGDMGQIVTAYYPQDLPVSTYLTELGSLPSDSFPLGAIQGSAATAEMFTSNESLVSEFEAHGLKPLTAYYLHRYPLLCTDSLGTPAEAAGTRVRTGGPVWSAEAEAMGMTAVPVPVTELYEGLQRGVVDCAALDASNSIDFSIWEVATHYYQVSMSGSPGIVLSINLDTWNSLPPEAQAIVQDGANTFWATTSELMAQKFARFAIEGAEEHGIEFGDPREFDALLAPAQEESRAAALASPPAEVADAEAFNAEYLDLLDKWEGILVEELDYRAYDKDPASLEESFTSTEDFDVSDVVDRLAQERG